MRMMMQRSEITPELLARYHATLLRLEKDSVIFDKGDHPNFYYVVCDGQVKMAVLHERGKEFIQGYFGPGESFGEPPFFVEEPYPAFAITVEKSTIWRVPRESFLELITDHPELLMQITRTLSHRLLYKSMMLNELAVGAAIERLRTLIEYLRQQRSPGSGPFQVPHTRQELADLTGLRVETVIRAIKSLESEGNLRINRGKIIWNPEENDPRGSDKQ